MSAPVPMDARTVDRLGALAGMLGSAHPGEQAAAATKATPLLRQHGLTWRQVIDFAFGRGVDEQENDPPDWEEQLEACAAQLSSLTEWERQFVGQLLRWGKRPSEKQLAILDQIHAKVAAL